MVMSRAPGNLRNIFTHIPQSFIISIGVIVKYDCPVVIKVLLRYMDGKRLEPNTTKMRQSAHHMYVCTFLVVHCLSSRSYAESLFIVFLVMIRLILFNCSYPNFIFYGHRTLWFSCSSTTICINRHGLMVSCACTVKSLPLGNLGVVSNAW